MKTTESEVTAVLVPKEKTKSTAFQIHITHLRLLRERKVDKQDSRRTGKEEILVLSTGVHTLDFLSRGCILSIRENVPTNNDFVFVLGFGVLYWVGERKRPGGHDFE